MTETKLRQLVREELRIAEAEEDEVADELGDEMEDFVRNLDRSLEKAAEKGDETMGEAAFVTGLSVAAALPAIMQLVSKFGKKAGEYVRSAIGKPPEKDTAYRRWMQKLGDIGDELHHLYMEPIEAVVGKFVDDEEKVHRISTYIFHAVVATLLLASGATAVKALGAEKLSYATLESALSAVKAGELKAFISRAFTG